MFKNRRSSSKLHPPFLKQITFSRDQASTDSFPFTIPLFKKDFTLEFEKPITILIGENGSGKSTLLEFIAHACGFNIQGGSRDHAYNAQGIESLDHLNALAPHLRLSWLPKVTEGFFMRAETFFNFLEFIHKPEWSDLERYYGGNLLQKSHGESFLAFFANRLLRGGMYLLDEPEAALSPMRQFEFLKVLEETENRQNAQIILVTHSPLLMGYPNADIYLFDYHGIRKTTLEETEHFLTMKQYFNDPRTFIKQFLERE